ncbi:MAG: hypothetical protein EXS08_05105 [Planctomycetes bacterium]|nr:hypothetical protein [Planctomycetota bacterium]
MASGSGLPAETVATSSSSSAFTRARRCGVAQPFARPPRSVRCGPALTPLPAASARWNSRHVRRCAAATTRPMSAGRTGAA